jgi:DNA-binding transcriptional LysR family regulator
MEIQQIRSFLAVARLGRFAKAADSIHRTQPAVTSAIKALERELGVKLFERRGRRATISPAGEALLSEAGPALQTWEGLKDRLAEHLDGETRGTLRIGAGESSILYLLPAFLEKFRKSNPKVRVILHNQRTADTLKMLKNGELDLGIRSVSSVPSLGILSPLPYI